MESIQKIGLQTPISVRWSPEDVTDHAVILIAGNHRLEACRRLGMPSVPVLVHEEDETSARLWEIAENLHRADLTVIDRAAHIAEWIRLTDSAPKEVLTQVASKPLGGRPEGGVRAAVRELGLDLREAQRAIQVDGLTDEAKQAARDTGLADNQAALLAAARQPAAEQADTIRQEAADREAKKIANKNRSTSKPASSVAAVDETWMVRAGNFYNSLSREQQAEYDWLVNNHTPHLLTEWKQAA